MFRRSLSRGGEVARSRLRGLTGAVIQGPPPANRTEPDASNFDAQSVPAELSLEPNPMRSLLVLVGAGLLVAIVLLLLNWPRGEAAPAAAVPTILGPTSSTQPFGSATPSASTTRIVVDVAGAVRHPGVRALPGGSRVIDALRAAGGLTHRADTTSLNLAQLLTDGEQVVVPTAVSDSGVTSGSAPDPSGSSAPGAAGTPVNINTASVDLLDGLPDIGPVLAQAIIDYRTQNGPFTSLDQLKDVSGIGDATYADLQGLVTL